jgi:hypothetical protein
MVARSSWSALAYVSRDTSTACNSTCFIYLLSQFLMETLCPMVNVGHDVSDSVLDGLI